MKVRFEGMTVEDLGGLSLEEWESLVLTGEPISFRAGSADVLGQFWIEGASLVVELAHIDGGGEGVLVTIWSLASVQARKWGLTSVDWRVHAVTCARPNTRLRELLERRGFQVETVEGAGLVYRLVREVSPA